MLFFYAKNPLQTYVNSASVLGTALLLKQSNNHAKISCQISLDYR